MPGTNFKMSTSSDCICQALGTARCQMHRFCRDARIRLEDDLEFRPFALQVKLLDELVVRPRREPEIN